MVRPVVDTDGKEAHVLEVSDLEEMKSSLIRWLVFTVVPATLLLGVYATRLDARNNEQDAVQARSIERISQNEAEIRNNRRLREQLDSLLIETRHLTDEVRAMNRTVGRAVR